MMANQIGLYNEKRGATPCSIRSKRPTTARYSGTSNGRITPRSMYMQEFQLFFNGNELEAHKRTQGAFTIASSLTISFESGSFLEPRNKALGNAFRM